MILKQAIILFFVILCFFQTSFAQEAEDEIPSDLDSSLVLIGKLEYEGDCEKRPRCKAKTDEQNQEFLLKLQKHYPFRFVFLNTSEYEQYKESGKEMPKYYFKKDFKWARQGNPEYGKLFFYKIWSYEKKEFIYQERSYNHFDKSLFKMIDKIRAKYNFSEIKD